MFNNPLLQRKFGHLPHLKKRTRNEWSAACPVCGDAGHEGNGQPDRFRIFDDDKPLGWCRKCGHLEFAQDDNELAHDPQLMAEMQRRRAELAEQENRNLRQRIAELKRSQLWIKYHDYMAEHHQRSLWRDAGIPDSLQDYWNFGINPLYEGMGQDGKFTSPAMSIPYFGVGREIKNMQYRLIAPPTAGDKYRFTHGLKVRDLWLAMPDEKPSGSVLICEGVKKGANAFHQIVAQGVNSSLSVVAIPNLTPDSDMLTLLADCDPVYICVDPDGMKPNKQGVIRAHVLANQIGARRVRIVDMPAKLDDLVLDCGFDGTDLNRYVTMARRA